MERTQLLKRAYFIKKNPELFEQLSNIELADFLQFFINSVAEVNEAIKAGKLAGYTPQEGKDYVGRKEALTIFKDAFEQAYARFCKTAAADHKKHQAEVATQLDELRNRPKFTEDDLWDIAYRAYQFLDLPDFENLITSSPAAVRDALELLEGDERLSIGAIAGLNEALDTKVRRAESRIGATVARRLGQIRDVNAEGATTGQVLTRRSDGTYDFQTPSAGSGITVETPTGTVDGSNATFTVTAIPKWIDTEAGHYYEGFGYSRSGLTITMEIPPGQFIRAII